MASKTKQSRERDRLRTEDFRQRFEEWRKSHSDSAWRVRGWKAKAAEATGMDPSVISRITTGARPVSVDHIVSFVEALKAPELLPSDVPMVSSSHRIQVDREAGSDLPAKVAAKPVPKDLAEYVAGRGQDERVTVGEFVRLAKTSFLEESGKPRSADFWHGILLAVRSE